MADDALTILGIAGSLRRRSVNARLLARAGARAPARVSVETFDRIGEIPHFSQDLEAETPEPVAALRRAIASADGLLIATPEYNSAMPGVLKNALDWASRPAGESVLADKPAAAIGASPGRFGAQRAQAEVRKVLAAIGAEVLDREFPLSRAHEAFAEDGTLADPELERGLGSFMAALADHACVEPAEESADAAYSRECQRLSGAA